MFVQPTADLNAEGLRIGIAISRYHADVTDALREGAISAFEQAGGDRENLVIAPAAGSFELTAICQALADRDDVDGVLALGCVIRGETMHDQYICEAVSQGLTRITLDTGKPVGFGLLTCHTKHQARERAGGETGNKGVEGMGAVIETIHTMRAIAGAS